VKGYTTGDVVQGGRSSRRRIGSRAPDESGTSEHRNRQQMEAT